MRASIDSMDSSVPRTGQTFRTAGSLRFGGTYSLIGAIGLIIYGATAHGASSTSTIAGRVFVFVWAGLMIVLSVRIFTLGVHATKDHVRIRNILITRRVQWSDVEQFSFGQLRIFPAVGIATLNDGRKLAMTGISLGRVARKKSRANAASLISELNQLLEEHRADARLEK